MLSYRQFVFLSTLYEEIEQGNTGSSSEDGALDQATKDLYDGKINRDEYEQQVTGGSGVVPPASSDGPSDEELDQATKDLYDGKIDRDEYDRRVSASSSSGASGGATGASGGATGASGGATGAPPPPPPASFDPAAHTRPGARAPSGPGLGKIQQAQGNAVSAEQRGQGTSAIKQTIGMGIDALFRYGAEGGKSELATDVLGNLAQQGFSTQATMRRFNQYRQGAGFGLLGKGLKFAGEKLGSKFGESEDAIGSALADVGSGMDKASAFFGKLDAAFGATGPDAENIKNAFGSLMTTALFDPRAAAETAFVKQDSTSQNARRNTAPEGVTGGTPEDQPEENPENV